MTGVDRRAVAVVGIREYPAIPAQGIAPISCLGSIDDDGARDFGERNREDG